MVNCPQCNLPIDIDEDELDEGDPITCEECGATLLVVGTDPVELAAENEEDDDEEDDEHLDEDEEEDEDDEEDEDEEW